MRREYINQILPDNIVMAKSMILENAAVIPIPYDMRNGFAVEIKASATNIQYSNVFISDLPTHDGRQIVQREVTYSPVSIRCKKSTTSPLAYGQFRNVWCDTEPHIIKASNQYNYNGQHYRAIFDGVTKSLSWSTGSPASYWGDATTLYVVSRDVDKNYIYYLKLYDKWGYNGLENVVNDLVPIGNTQTGEGGLLDLLTGELYWNVKEGGKVTYEL